MVTPKRKGGKHNMENYRDCRDHRDDRDRRDRRDDREKKRLEDIIKKLPPNYAVGGVFLNGLLVPVTNFSNATGDLGYFINDGQVVLVDTDKVDGLAFGEPEEAEEEEEE